MGGPCPRPRKRCRWCRPRTRRTSRWAPWRAPHKRPSCILRHARKPRTLMTSPSRVTAIAGRHIIVAGSLATFDLDFHLLLKLPFDEDMCEANCFRGNGAAQGPRRSDSDNELLRLEASPGVGGETLHHVVHRHRMPG